MKIKLLLTLCLALLSAGGCKTTPEDVAFKTTGTITVLASPAYAAYLDYALATGAPADQQQKVKALYDKYYAAVQAESAAVNAYKSGTDTNALPRAVLAVTAASADVVTLILQFLPPAKAAQLKGIQ